MFRDEVIKYQNLKSYIDKAAADAITVLADHDVRSSEYEEWMEDDPDRYVNRCKLDNWKYEGFRISTNELIISLKQYIGSQEYEYTSVSIPYESFDNIKEYAKNKVASQKELTLKYLEKIKTQEEQERIEQEKQERETFERLKEKYEKYNYELEVELLKTIKRLINLPDSKVCVYCASIILLQNLEDAGIKQDDNYLKILFNICLNGKGNERATEAIEERLKRHETIHT